jgi:putative FmdB family regulatory protein
VKQALPLYEYRCTSCNYRFDKIQKFNEEPETVCPKCGGELIRPLTAPALQFKGAGWYVNDYASKPAATSSSDKAAGDSAPKSGESKPADAKSAESKSAESKPAAETKSSAASESSSKPASTSSSGN